MLIDLGDNAPRLFRPVLSNVLTVMVTIAKDKSFEDRTRQTALELLLTLCEAAAGMCRKTPNFANEIIPVAMEMITDIEDDETWYTTEDVSDYYKLYIKIISIDNTQVAYTWFFIYIFSSFSWMKMIMKKIMLWVKVLWIV